MSNKNKIESILSEYFNGVQADIDVIMVGKIPYIDITYTDFKPSSQVAQDLLSMIPNIELSRLERKFSPESICKELLLAYREDVSIIMQDDEDTFRRMTLGIFIEERMQHKTIV